MLSMKTGINREYVHSPRGPKVNRTDRKFNTSHFRVEENTSTNKDFISPIVCSEYPTAYTYFEVN